LGDDAKEIVRYHPVMPFKTDERIMEHITKAITNDYGKGEYNVFTNNCEHFADMIVYGIKLSEQLEKIKEKIKNKVNEIKYALKNPLKTLFLTDLEGKEGPAIYYAKVNLKEKMKEGDRILGNLGGENEREHKRILSDL